MSSGHNVVLTHLGFCETKLNGATILKAPGIWVIFAVTFVAKAMGTLMGTLSSMGKINYGAMNVQSETNDTLNSSKQNVQLY